LSLSIAALALWGILAIFTSNDFLPIWLPLAIGIFTFTLNLLLPENKRALLALLGAALILGGLSLTLQNEITKPDWLVQLAKSETTSNLQVKVLNRPKVIYSDFANKPVSGVAVALEKLADKPVSGRGYLIYSGDDLKRGQVISFQGKFSEAGRNARDAFLLKPIGQMEVVSEPSGQIEYFNSLRANYVDSISGITPDARVLVAGLAIGEISELSETLEQQMRTVSLTHLVAVSGSNCAIVVGLVYLIAVRLRFGIAGRTIISLAALVSYILLVGPDPSVLRAGVMTAAVILMIALGRRTWAINALAIAGIVLLIADPWLAVDYGFGLSVLATAGILVLAPAMAKKLASKMPMPLALGLSVTMAAQLWCLPLLMQLQPGLPTYSVIANLLAGPMVAPVTVIGMIAVILTPVAPWAVGLISWIASLGTYVIELVAIFFAELPVAYFPWATGLLASAISLLLIIAVSAWLKSERIFFKQAGIAGVVIIAVATLSVPAASEVLPKSWPIQQWQLVACDIGQGDAFVIRSLGRVAVIDVGPDEKLVDYCLSELGIKSIDLLVLTHFDFDHVGGLSGALSGRSVSTAIISGFVDERPATQDSLEQLRQIGAEVIVADPSIEGVLGDYTWRILAPTKTASEARDSNDASVVMLFSSNEADMLFLGDLGSAGQERIKSAVLQLRSKSSNSLILKVSHHGSNDQSESFHRALSPKLSVISVGEKNGYGHPGKSLLALLESTGSKVLRTDTQGAIAIGLDGGKLSWASTGR
jgi:competence protein ComEC